MRKIGLCSLFLVTSCMTYDPYTNEQKVSNATTGAIIGGAAGVVLGNQVKGNRKTRDQAMIAGGLLGAAAGSAVGNRIDKQEAQLRHQLQNSGVSITRQGKQILLNTPGNVTFDTNSSAIKPEFESILTSIASVLKEFKNTNVEISGHADSKGSASANQMLSEQRANAVGAFLRSSGVSGSRIFTHGYGSSNQISTDAASNRRVEIKLSTPE